MSLLPVTSLKPESLNPRDYLDYSRAIKVRTEPLSKLGIIRTETSQVQSKFRVMSDDVDRTTGEVVQGHEPENQITSVPFGSGDILLHKYRSRIGRVGLASFKGYADAHFMIIKPRVLKHYLLLSLRSRPVLVQLPFRETTRPGFWKSDLEKCKIPRLDEVTEQQIEEFLRDIFRLRSRAKQVIRDVRGNFDRAVQKAVPTENAFLQYPDEMTDQTLDPGYYFLKALDLLFPDHVILGDQVTITYPSSLNAGRDCKALTLADYGLEGISPSHPKAVSVLHDKNYAKPLNVILNRLQSGARQPAKAVVVLPSLDYLKDLGISLRVGKNGTEVAVYDQLFILSMKKGAKLSPYYLSLFLNSVLFQHIFEFMMGGTTGRQRIRKTKLKIVRVPTFKDGKMDAFSEVVRISTEILSVTLRMLLTLSRLFEQVALGKRGKEEITRYMKSEQRELSELASKSVVRARELAKTTENLVYATCTPIVSDSPI